MPSTSRYKNPLIALALVVSAAVITAFATDHIHSWPPLLILAVFDLVAAVIFYTAIHRLRVKNQKGRLPIAIIIIASLMSATCVPAAPLTQAPKESVHFDKKGNVVVAFMKSDGRLVDSQGEPAFDAYGRPMLVVNGELMAINSDGSIHPAFVAACLAVVGTAVVGYMLYKIYRCAKDNIAPPEPPPPPPPPPPVTNNPATNNPPTNLPPKKVKVTLTAAIQKAMLTQSGTVDTSGFTNGVDGFEWWFCGSAYGNDWDGNPWIWCFSQTVTNQTCGNSKLWWQSSTNMIQWRTETCSITGYVSCYYGVDTNGVAICYDSKGIPFATNWWTYSAPSNQVQYVTPTSALLGLPVDPEVPQKFYRQAITY